VQSCRSVLELARRAGVDVPITQGVVQVCHEGLAATNLVPALMGRGLKDERPVTA
jgi:glycerol-3-phosphate dehydrogenase (NAD(P)+)